MSCKRRRKIDRPALRHTPLRTMHQGQVLRRILRARDRALITRIWRTDNRKDADRATRSIAATLRAEWCDPFGDETQPRRDRERSRRVLALALSLTSRWRHRRPACGQCGERDPETPCGNPCNQCPF